MSELFTLDTLQEFFAKRPNGAKLQESEAGAVWRRAGTTPTIYSAVQDWRWEPQSKPVDLSPLVGSDVFCEFGIGKESYGFLRDITRFGRFIDDEGVWWDQCNPVMNKWMAVSAGQKIPDGLICYRESTGEGSVDVVMFTGLLEGYHWPWEDK